MPHKVFTEVRFGGKFSVATPKSIPQLTKLTKDAKSLSQVYNPVHSLASLGRVLAISWFWGGMRRICKYQHLFFLGQIRDRGTGMELGKFGALGEAELRCIPKAEDGVGRYRAFREARLRCITKAHFGRLWFI
eukprot:jgi/Bigna1/131041/aug1.13_g5749